MLGAPRKTLRLYSLSLPCHARFATLGGLISSPRITLDGAKCFSFLIEKGLQVFK